MNYKLTIISDNKALPGFQAEHGYSVLVESRDFRLLFDTGQGEAFNQNLEKLNIDLTSINCLALSHGHYDHTGGVATFFNRNKSAPVYCLQGANKKRYSRKESGRMKYIGMPEEARRLFSHNDPKRLRIISSDESFELTPGIGISGPVKRTTEFEKPEPYFFLDEQAIVHDPIKDDLSLWLDTSQGLVILCGCCHAGLINTIKTIRQRTGKQKIHAIIGGLHLAKASKQKLKAVFSELNSIKPQFIMPAHCTGDAFEQIPDGLLDNCKILSSAAGKVFDLPFQ
ncbi:MAG: MBL fold metallo-hydrolase [Candidatus Rifleibacteriota bacterium]